MRFAHHSPETMRRALEEALAEDPDDVATHSAYADFLLEQDDADDAARGEFIAVQLALEDESRPARERAKLRLREKSLLRKYQRRWLGELAPFLLDGEVPDGNASSWFFDQFPVFRDSRPPWWSPEQEWTAIDCEAPVFRFRRGWLDQVHLPSLSLYLARSLKDAPEARLLRELTIDEVGECYGGVTPEDGVSENDRFSAGLCPLTNAPSLGNVRVFRLGPDQGDDYRHYRCYLHSSVVVKIVRQMPRVEELRLFANGYDLNDLFRSPTLSRLRVLQVYHHQQVHRLQILAENPALCNLTHLLLHPHNAHSWWQNGHLDDAAGYRPREGFLPLSVVVPLLRAPTLPKLAHLRLRVSSMGDAGCREIVRGGILGRLKTLDLRHGVITNEGAEVLCRCPDLRRLEWLDLDRNALTVRGRRMVNNLGIPVLTADDQQTRREVNNRQYLSEAEFE